MKKKIFFARLVPWMWFCFYFFKNVNIYSFKGEESRYLDPPKDHRGAYIPYSDHGYLL